ncbi:MAG: CvpA family protein [Clostridia bacterium]|nr:CvpA family protein [Clostridia bacterium]
MNGFLDQPFVWDLLFLLIFLLCIALSAKRGGFEAISGIAGTVLGVIIGRRFQLELAVKLQPLLEPKLLALAQKTDLTQVGGLQEGSALTELIQQSTAVTDKVSELYTSLIAAIAKQLSENLASILAFLLLFFAVKLAVRLVCLLLKLDIPILSGLNRTAGGILGAVSGLLLILALCWAVMQFAPEGDLSLLSRGCLQESLIGGFFTRLF